MKRILVILFTLGFLITKAQFCSTVTVVNMGGITPTGALQTVTGAASAKRYWTFNATVGCTYTLSTCGSLNSNDTYLRLYSGSNPLTAVLVTSNDDNGPVCTGTKASIVWTCPTSGVYSILLTNYSCANLSASTTLRYRVVCAPPFNPCSGLYPAITCGINVNWTVPSGNGAYNPPTTTCGFSTPGQEKIYVFTAPATGNYTINQLSSFNWIDYFFKPTSGGCSGTGWTCIDDLSGTFSSVSFSLTSGVQYYIILDPESTPGGNVSFNIACPPVSLPIELALFEGFNRINYNLINWVTASELNNDYFTLERSTDGLCWNNIASIKGAGTVSTPSFYSYKDHTLINNTINYYRLKQVDFDKTSTYSNIIYIENINSEQLINLIKITDILGRTVDSNYQGIVLYYYSDGKVVKAIQ